MPDTIELISERVRVGMSPDMTVRTPDRHQECQSRVTWPGGTYGDRDAACKTPAELDAGRTIRASVSSDVGHGADRSLGDQPWLRRRVASVEQTQFPGTRF